MEFLILIPVLLFLFYVLYINGLMVLSSKRAVLYVGADRGNSARFVSCSGYTKRALRFPANGSYTIHFSCELTKGSLTITITDSNKQELVCFQEDSQTFSFSVEKGKRYFLAAHMDDATGSYSLKWL